MSLRRPLCCLLLLLLPACASSNAVLTGVVRRSTSGRPIPQVLVTATSPELDQERLVMTDAAGQYRIPQLPAGTYLLLFEPGWGPEARREGVSVPEGRTVRLDVVLEPGGADGSTASPVDTGGTAVSVDADFIRNIAVLRTCPPGEDCGSWGRQMLDGCLPPTPPGQGSRQPSWAHPYAPLVRPTGEPQRVHCSCNG